MPKAKLGTSTIGESMHYSVGAIIEKNGQYLLIDRVNPPYGFAGIAGHIDESEEPTQSLKREVKEESGLDVISYKLIFVEEINWNQCKHGVSAHEWYVFACKTKGEVKLNPQETKSIGWYFPWQIKEMAEERKLEEVWEHWFKLLKIL